MPILHTIIASQPLVNGLALDSTLAGAPAWRALPACRGTPPLSRARRKGYTLLVFIVKERPTLKVQP
jgi:hypothetical protein